MPGDLTPLALVAPAAAALALAWLEWRYPARRPPHVRARVISNLVLGATGWVLARLAQPLALVAVALWADSAGFGLVAWLGLGGGPAVVLACWIALDAAIWAQHVAFHKVPVLWRLHRVHHSDTAMDLTTGVRFHPGEILLSQLWKALVVALLGAPIAAVVLFQTLLSVMAFVTHANVALPPPLERVVRLVFVTPALHLAHHHPDRHWTDSTYGNVFSVWDRCAGLLRPAPPDDAIGLERFRAPGDQRLAALLRQPLDRP